MTVKDAFLIDYDLVVADRMKLKKLRVWGIVVVACGLCLFLKCNQFEIRILPSPFQVVFHGGTLKNIIH